MTDDRSHGEHPEVYLSGVVTWEETGEPLAGGTVRLHAGLEVEVGDRASAVTDKQGRFVTSLERWDDTACDCYFSVTDRAGRLLLSTYTAPITWREVSWEVSLSVPGRPPTRRRIPVRPLIQVGPLLLDAERVSAATPEHAVAVARSLLGVKVPQPTVRLANELFPDLGPSELIERTLCGTSILLALDSLIEQKRWPREVGLEIDDILTMRGFGFQQTYNCPNFSITYQDSGPAAVDSDTSAQSVTDPGSSPPVVIGSLPAGSPPTYIKRVCFWLERALASYTTSPFSMRNPAAGGRIPVVINSAPYGTASPSVFYLNNALNPDLLCAVAVHELFHMVQFQYGGSGLWNFSMMEGGAVFAEDTAADLMNRYLDEAGTNFNGIGVMSNPNLSLDTAGYKCSLFWRYIAEQQSGDITEPFVGVETYRRIMELTSAGSYSTDDVRQAIRELPWYQDFYEFGYLDATRLDLLGAETTLGNYALACYLKDLGTSLPDRRFDFIEDDENIYIDSVIPGAPSQTTLASPVLTGTATISPTVSAAFSSSVNRFAHRYYEVNVDPSVTNVAIAFTAGTGLTSSLFQIVLIDEDGQVRDIHRTDKAAYSKRVTNVQAGKRLTKIVLVVTGANSGGGFTISASAASAAPDVMITRWHSVVQTEYEIDSFGWAWTWVSPDVWVDNDANGVADSEVFFNFNNQLHIRLHNKGNAVAAAIQVTLDYQDASGGLSPTGWLPVQDMAGATQLLTGLSLAAGATSDWVVNWSPTPSGASHHFCIRAVVTVPGDPNTDNKRVMSNFGNVVIRFGGLLDIDLIRRNILDRLSPITLRVVPRLTPDIEVSLRDIRESQTALLLPGETRHDLIRLSHRPLAAVVDHGGEVVRPSRRTQPGALTVSAGGRTRPGAIEVRPDPRGYYGTNPEALPPGVAGRPLVTIVHEVGGLPLGGATFLVTVQGEAQRRPPRSSGRAGSSQRQAARRRAPAKRARKA
jgi:hypothetical protein